jgi:Zn-dependent protease with chaperone function
MAMDRAAFEALITRMESLATNNPAGYRRRVFVWALLGYGCLLIVLVVLLAPLLLIRRSMWVSMEPPAGERLERKTSPELFGMLDELRRQLHTPQLDHVLLTPDFNAGVMQVPRLGLFGWHRSYLFVGLPLMKSLTVEQFQAVLAHELGHLSRGHASSGNWIYRLRLTLQRLENAFAATPHWGSRPIRAFFRWYIPRFSATSFPLARANEYEADAAAVKLTSARSAAQALTAVSIVGSYLSEKYWPKIHSAARELPQPAFAPYSEFMATAIRAVPAAELRTWQEAALVTKTSYDDTHPALADRLQAMGAEAEFAPPLEENSAERLLGAERSRLEAVFDAQWRERVAESWRQVHENARVNRERMAALRANASLAEAESLELADLEEDVGAGPAAALAMRQALLEKYPNSRPLRFSLARQLLQAGDPAGVARMEALIEREPGAYVSGAELLRDYYWRRNQMQMAKQWHRRALERHGR